MSALQWDGLGSVCSSPDTDEPRGDQVRLRVFETLVELAPSPRVLVCWAVVDKAGPESALAPGTQVIARCSRAASALTLDAGQCRPIASPDTGPCLLSLLAEALGAIDRARPDLGWNALVVGSSLRSELLLLLARHSGARHLASLRVEGAPPPAEGPVELFQGDPASVHPALSVHLKQVRGPLVAFCDASDTREVLAVLAALPPRSTLVLLDGSGSGADLAAVNFCDDVHRKNLRVDGCGPGAVEQGHWLRASALVRHGRLDLDRLGVGRVEAKEGTCPESEGRWLVLAWPTR